MQRRDFAKFVGGGVAGSFLLPGLARPLQAATIAEQAWQSTGWYCWRGPSGKNIAAAGNRVPNSITAERLQWKADVPGRGHSSPIVSEDFVFLTTADKQSGLQGVLAYERQSGRGVWNQVVHRGGLARENHPKNTEASPTLAFDGKHLFAVFYNDSALKLTKLDTAGKIIWQQNLGHYSPQRYKYGYAASPLLYEGAVIVVGDYDGQPFLTARDRDSGKEIWRVARPKTISFSSPIVAQTGGREQLLLSGAERVVSYDPRTGRVIWETPCTTMATCGTMVWNENMVFASGGYPKKETVCLDATNGNVVWSIPQKCYEQSMLYFDGHIYAVVDSGVAYCWRASDGETMWRQRLGGDYSSSPILVGNTIHVFNEQGDGFAFSAAPGRYNSLGKSRVGDEVFATPSVVDDTMYLRVANRTPNGRRESLLAIA